MSAAIYNLPLPSLSRMIAAQDLGDVTSAREITAATRGLRGQVPDADLVLAACRRFCAVVGPVGLLELLDALDDILEG